MRTSICTISLGSVAACWDDALPFLGDDAAADPGFFFAFLEDMFREGLSCY
jgi:hypothetical protein